MFKINANRALVFFIAEIPSVSFLDQIARSTFLMFGEFSENLRSALSRR